VVVGLFPGHGAFVRSRGDESAPRGAGFRFAKKLLESWPLVCAGLCAPKQEGSGEGGASDSELGSEGGGSDGDNNPEVSDEEEVDAAAPVAPEPPVAAPPAAPLPAAPSARWVPGWRRDKPDPGPPRNPFRQTGVTFEEGPTAFARRQEVDHPGDAFALLWTPDLARRIIDRTNLKLDILKQPRMDMLEFLRLLALQITLGLKHQGSVPSYWDTTHFGRSRTRGGTVMHCLVCAAQFCVATQHALAFTLCKPCHASHVCLRPLPCPVQPSATTTFAR